MATALSIEQHLAQLTPQAARSYLAGYARARLPVPLTEYQAAIVRARARADQQPRAARQGGGEAAHPAGVEPGQRARLTVA